MFRISYEEYERLQEFWTGSNYRSFSEMVRSAIQSWVANGGRFDPSLEFRVREVEQRLASLSARIETIEDPSRSASR